VTAHAAPLTRRADLTPKSESPRAEPPIRLLLVDDSSVARAVLTRMIAGRPGLEVAATASSAAEALALLGAAIFDIVILDIEMPGESGLDALPDILRAGRGARVLIVSSLAECGAEASVRALALGAADAMSKPGSGMFGGRFADELAERLRRIGRVGAIDRNGPAGKPARLRDVHDWRPSCIAIGASTGGIPAIHDFLAGLPPRVGLPILVTQHLPPLFMPYFARQLEQVSGRATFVAEDGVTLIDDAIHIAPGKAHLRVAVSGGKVRVALDERPAPSGCRPSVDPMLASVGEVYGRGGVAVVLSGMGRDGLIGSGALAAAGGIVLAQDEASSAIWGMPRAVAEAGLATAILSPGGLAAQVTTRIGGGTWR
jgi:two-component system chemotaxis response regulator CheB